MLAYLDDSDHGGGLAAHIFARSQSLKGFASDIIRETLDIGFLTLFVYEVMHEMICVKYRDETDGSDPKRILLSTAEIRNEHNNTLQRLLVNWKPTAGASTVSAMKVHPPSILSRLT